jgi:hypothetical protein
MPDRYPFDCTNLARIMRECLIYLINADTGVDEATGQPNPTNDPDVFWRNQQRVSRLRQKVTKAYRSAGQLARIQKQPDPPPVWAFGLAIYDELVEQGSPFRDVLKLSSRRISRLATRLHAELTTGESHLS